MRDPWLDTNAERLTIPETAQRLGTTIGTVNRWIREKRLEALRVDGTWYVWLPRDKHAGHESHDDQAPSSGDQGQQHDNSPHDAGQDAVATISTLRAVIQFLKSELNNRTEELRRKDYIIAALIAANASMTNRGEPEGHWRERETAWHQDGPRRQALSIEGLGQDELSENSKG